MEIKDANPEQELSPDLISEPDEEETVLYNSQKQVNPVLIMLIIALLCAILLAASIFFAMPYMNEPPETLPAPTEVVFDEDPEAALHQQNQAEPEPLPTIEPVIEPEANP